MDHSTHVRLDEAELTQAILHDATVYGPGDETIGHVSEVLGSGGDIFVVIDVGGFLGIGAKPVAVPARELDFMRDATGGVHAVTGWTKEQLTDMTEYQP